MKKLNPIQIYSDEKMHCLFQGALRVLHETGFSLDNNRLLNKFESRGMHIDWTRKRVLVDEKLVCDLLDPQPIHPLGPIDIDLFPMQFSLAGSYPKYLDWANKTSQMGNCQILLELIRVFNNVDNIKKIGRFMSLTDVPQPIEPIIATGLTIKNSRKPGRGGVYRADNLPYLVELGELVTGQSNCTDFISNCTFMVPPLKMTADEAELIIARTELGIKAVAGTMPLSGATAPVTREGTIVIELAEIMGLWLCARLINPEVSLGCICASASMDMKHASPVFSSAETVIQDCATAQIIRRYFNAEVSVANNYVDAKMPGVQTSYEKLFKTWWTMQFIGQVSFDCGLLEAGRTFCPAQALLDMDIWQTVATIFKPSPTTEQQIPFDDIHQIATQGGMFLETEHTFSMFRGVLQETRLLDHSPWKSDAIETLKAAELLDRAQADYEKIKQLAPEYVASDEICREVDKIVQQASKHIIDQPITTALGKT